VELVRLGKLRWRIEQDYGELKSALGLDHFEGRSFGGWHHVTLVSIAHGFFTLERQRSPNLLPSACPCGSSSSSYRPCSPVGRRLPDMPASRATLAVPTPTITSTNLTEPY
jgi:SRSO17 transposase